MDRSGRKLEQLEHQWVEAVRDRDLETLERVLGEEFTLTTGRPGNEVRSRYRQTGSMDGAERNQTYLMTDVWVRRAGRWQAVTRHVSPLEA